jgi:hypothetical protein
MPVLVRIIEKPAKGISLSTGQKVAKGWQERVS